MADIELLNSEILECNVCMVPFDERRHAPLSLPCGHTSCAKCVVEIVRSKKNTSIPCPYCQKECPMTLTQTTASFAKNYRLLHLICELKKRRVAATGVPEQEEQSDEEEIPEAPEGGVPHQLLQPPYFKPRVLCQRDILTKMLERIYLWRQKMRGEVMDLQQNVFFPNRDFGMIKRRARISQLDELYIIVERTIIELPTPRGFLHETENEIELSARLEKIERSIHNMYTHEMQNGYQLRLPILGMQLFHRAVNVFPEPEQEPPRQNPVRQPIQNVARADNQGDPVNPEEAGPSRRGLPPPPVNNFVQEQEEPPRAEGNRNGNQQEDFPYGLNFFEYCGIRDQRRR